MPSTYFFTPAKTCFAAILVALLMLVPATTFACSSGGGGGSDDGGGGGLFNDLYHPGKKKKKEKSKPDAGQWSPPGFFTPPEDNNVVIHFDIPLRIEPVTTGTYEPVELVEITSGMGGHPTSGRLADGRYVTTTYVDIVRIVHDPDLGWVGVTQGLRKIALPTTPFIQRVITHALAGTGEKP